MKISINDTELFTLTETQLKVLRDDIPNEIFEAEIKRRITYYPIHKCEQNFKRMKARWEPILASRKLSIPPDEEEFAQLVFSQPDYKDRSARDLEAKLK